MTTFNTGNAVPSADARDRFDNSQTFDEVINGTLTYYKNRVGNNILSLKGMSSLFDSAQISRTDEFNQFLENSGYETPVVYAPGLNITRPTQTVRYMGEIYRPKSASLPFITTTFPADEAKWIANGDNSLRQELAAPTGSGKSGHARASLKKKPSTVADALNANDISIMEYADLAIGYVEGGNPSDWDWSPALQAAYNDIFGYVGVAGQYSSNVNHSGKGIHLTSQVLRLKTPVIAPAGGGVTIKGGMIFADASFPVDRYMIEHGHATNTGFMNENVSYERVIMDARHTGGCLLLRNTIRTDLDSCQFMRYALEGVWAARTTQNFEVTISECKFGYRSFGNTTFDNGLATIGGFGVRLTATDNRIANCIFYSAKGVYAGAQGQRISGSQFYGNYPEGAAIEIRSSLVNVADCDFGKNAIHIYDPFNVTVKDCRFIIEEALVTDFAISLRPTAPGRIMAGVDIGGNSFTRSGGVRCRAIVYDSSAGTITRVRGSKIGPNVHYACDETATTVERSIYVTTATTTVFDVSDVIPFGSLHTALPGFANQGATNVSANLAGNLATLTRSNIPVRLSAAGTGNIMIKVSVEEPAE